MTKQTTNSRPGAAQTVTHTLSPQICSHLGGGACAPAERRSDPWSCRQCLLQGTDRHHHSPRSSDTLPTIGQFKREAHPT